MMLNGQALAMTLGQWIVLTGGGPRQPALVAEATCQEVIVSQVRVHNFSVSLDGFGTGEGQSLDAPFGHAGTWLHEWFFPTRTFRAMQGQPGGSTGIDDAFASAWAPGIGAEIMGRGKFGPHHGPWPDQEWNGWWGDTPPFHTPTLWRSRLPPRFGGYRGTAVTSDRHTARLVLQRASEPSADYLRLAKDRHCVARVFRRSRSAPSCHRTGSSHRRMTARARMGHLPSVRVR